MFSQLLVQGWNGEEGDTERQRGEAYLSPHLSKGLHSLLQLLFHFRQFRKLSQLLFTQLELLLDRSCLFLLQLKTKAHSCYLYTLLFNKCHINSVFNQNGSNKLNLCQTQQIQLNLLTIMRNTPNCTILTTCEKERIFYISN